MQKPSPKSFTLKRSLFIIFTFILLAGLTVSCSSSGEKSPGVNPVRSVGLYKPQDLALPSEGGTLEFENGIQMIVPPGAVAEDTEISLNLVKNGDVKEYLNEGDFPTEPLVFFEVHNENLILHEPIRVILPVSDSDMGDGWPIHVSLDLDTGEVEYHPTEIFYDPETGTIEFSLEHFSTNGAAKKTDKKAEKKCNDPGGACRCGRIYVKSSFHDYSVGDCQSISDEVSVQFLDCPGQPTEKHKMSEIAGDCIAMGTLAFHGTVVAEGYEIQMNCSDPIPFVIGGSNTILGGGPMQCVVKEDIEGMMIDMFVDEQVSLTGKFDGVNLNFDPPEAENVSGHMKSWVMVEGEKFVILDMVFNDETASGVAGEFMGMTMMSFSGPTDGGDINRSQFAFSIPLDTTGQAEIVFQEDEATVIVTITMELDY